MSEKEILVDFSVEILERFVRYTSIPTTCDPDNIGKRSPSSDGQLVLLKELEEEMRRLGVSSVTLNPNGFLFGHIPATDPEKKRVAFFAHVDTAEDVPSIGKVCPCVHKDYDGEDIVLGEGIVISPKDSPALSHFKGETIITADGTTLLGADDKAGVTEIMTLAAYLCSNRGSIAHGDIDIVFTPDEETGCGMDLFPWDTLKADYCFTVDGGGEGEVEVECYNAAGAEIFFTGRAIHPGYGRGKLVNALTMAGTFMGMMPRSESPEATDGRYGNYWPQKLSGSVESAKLTIMIRDFEKEGMARRKKAIQYFAEATLASFPGGEIEVRIVDQYKNMAECLDQYPEVREGLLDAVRACGIKPVMKPIRGGTDGARLCEKGFPTPNIFAGGHNFHSKKEWVALSSMNRSVNVLLNLLKQNFFERRG